MFEQSEKGAPAMLAAASEVRPSVSAEKLTAVVPALTDRCKLNHR
jgi:hypothetical protein